MGGGNVATGDDMELGGRKAQELWFPSAALQGLLKILEGYAKHFYVKCNKNNKIKALVLMNCGSWEKGGPWEAP